MCHKDCDPHHCIRYQGLCREYFLWALALIFGGSEWVDTSPFEPDQQPYSGLMTLNVYHYCPSILWVTKEHCKVDPFLRFNSGSTLDWWKLVLNRIQCSAAEQLLSVTVKQSNDPGALTQVVWFPAVCFWTSSYVVLVSNGPCTDPSPKIKSCSF